MFCTLDKKCRFCLPFSLFLSDPVFCVAPSMVGKKTRSCLMHVWSASCLWLLAVFVSCELNCTVAVFCLKTEKRSFPETTEPQSLDSLCKILSKLCRATTSTTQYFGKNIANLLYGPYTTFAKMPYRDCQGSGAELFLRD